MKRLFIIQAMCLFIFVSCVSEIKWKKYSYPEANFAISFPKEPEIFEKTIQIPNTNFQLKQIKYCSFDDAGTFYDVSYSLYPSEINTISIERRIQGALDSMLAVPGTTLISTSAALIDTFPATDFTFINSQMIHNKSALIKFRAISFDRCSYFLIVLDHKENFKEEKARAFFSSFDINI